MTRAILVRIAIAGTVVVLIDLGISSTIIITIINTTINTSSIYTTTTIIIIIIIIIIFIIIIIIIIIIVFIIIIIGRLPVHAAREKRKNLLLSIDPFTSDTSRRISIITTKIDPSDNRRRYE